MSREFDDLTANLLSPEGRKKATSRMSLSGFLGRNNRQSNYQVKVEDKGQVQVKDKVKRWGLKILQGKPKSIVEDQRQVKVEDKGQVKVKDKGQVQVKDKVKRWGLKILQGKPKSIVEDQRQVKVEDQGQRQIWGFKILQGKPKSITECGRIIAGIEKNIEEYQAKKVKSKLKDIKDNYSFIITNLKTKIDEYTK